jgi:hypothetical protein
MGSPGAPDAWIVAETKRCASRHDLFSSSVRSSTGKRKVYALSHLSWNGLPQNSVPGVMRVRFGERVTN